MKFDDYKDRIDELAHERVAIVPYDPQWPVIYEQEGSLLEQRLPGGLILRIAHIGSTAVPGLGAKPIIDMQVEVASLLRVEHEAVPVMEALGYECVWRPTIGEPAPYYAWFIKRNNKGQRTHHVHMVEPDVASNDRIIFRDRLCADPEEAGRYEALKRRLAAVHPDDRTAYAREKTAYITAIIRQERSHII